MKNQKLLTLTLCGALALSALFSPAKALAANDVENVLGALVAIDQIFGSGKKSASSNNVSVASLSNQKHARPNPTHNEKLFILAVEKHDIGTAKEMLAVGVDVNGVYKAYFYDDGFTALSKALHTDDRDMLQFLLESGADVNGYWNFNNNYICYIADSPHYKSLSLLEYLHNWGADINGRDYYGNNALTNLLHNYYESDYAKAEYFCKEGINIDCVSKNSPNGRTPFLWVVGWGNIKLANLLASYGANLSARDNQGKNVLDIALETNNLQVYKAVQDILVRGQQPSIYREKIKANAKNGKKVL